MSDTAKKKRRRWTDDFPGEITQRTQAAINVVQMAKSLGFIGRLMSILSGSCGKLPDDATDSPRSGERRKDKWRGQEKGIESEDPTNTGDDGESRFWDQKAIEGLRALEKKRMRRKLQRHTDDSSREE